MPNKSLGWPLIRAMPYQQDEGGGGDAIDRNFNEYNWIYCNIYFWPSINYLDFFVLHILKRWAYKQYIYIYTEIKKNIS